MATWILKTEIDDPGRAVEMFEDQRRKGYKVWIEDKEGKNVDAEFLQGRDAKQTQRSWYDIAMAALIWGTTAVIAVGVLYALSLLDGD
jgi:hypothetical protein